MSEALTLHMENEESLQRSKVKLEMSNRQLNAEKELNQQLVKEKIAQARQHKRLIKELQVCVYVRVSKSMVYMYVHHAF